jgi:transposase InsO family protein
MSRQVKHPGQFSTGIHPTTWSIFGRRQQGERRLQRPKTHHPVPRLVADAPNVVWSWDITKLATWTRGVFVSLYVV